MPTPNHFRNHNLGTSGKIERRYRAPIWLPSIPVIILLFPLLLLSCERDELHLPTLPTVGLENLHLDGFVLRASVQEGSGEFRIVERGFVLTKEAFDPESAGVMGIYPETDQYVPAKTVDGAEFSAPIEELEINHQVYAVKAYLTIVFEARKDTIYSRETAYGQTEGIRITSRAVEQNATLTLSLSILGLGPEESLSDHGIIWIDNREEPLPALPEPELGTTENTISLGELHKDSVGITIRPDLPKGGYLYLRPYAVFKGQPVYGAVREAYLGNFWKILGPEEYGEGPGLLAYATAFELEGKGYVVTGKKYLTPINFNVFAPSRQCWQFDPEDNSWAKMPDLPEEAPARCYATSFVIGDKAYVGGGWDGRENVYKDFYEFSPPPNAGWRRVGDMVSPIYAPASFVIDGKGYIATGRRCEDGVESEDCFFTGRLYQFGPENGQWVRLFDEGIGDDYLVFLPVTFVHHSTAFLGTGILHNFHKDFHSFSPDGGWIHNIADLPGPGRWAAFSFSIDRKYYVGGGAHYCQEYYESWDNCGGFLDVWRFDPDSEGPSWEQIGRAHV